MRVIVLVACLSACVQRVQQTRVMLFDRSELAIAGSGALPSTEDVVLPGRPDEVLAFDGTKLRMHLVHEAPFCRRRERCRPVLDLRIDTPLANVRAIHAVNAVASHHVIPLGVVTGLALVALGGGMIAYDRAEHLSGSITPPALAIGFGLAILAVEIHARLASDEVTVVR